MPAAARLRRLLATALLVLLTALTVAGCGRADADRVAQDVKREARNRADDLRQRAEAARRQAERRVDRIRARIEEVLGQIRAAVPRAQHTSPRVQARGRTGTTTIDAFLTDVLQSVDDYWTKTFRANGLPAPSVRYDWIPPGGRQLTGCGAVADDNAAFYCPSDDTIYVAQRFAADLYNGVLRNLPGERTGQGHAAGDFGVAYVVAHEYAHNIQDELGLFRLGRDNASKPFELQADCMAGTWGASVYAAGRVDQSDIQEAVDTALAVGDFDYSSANHHGTPAERRDAWLTGFRQADPGACSRYVPA
jgi:predicted metalloprotease